MAETSNRQLKSKNTNKAPRFQSSEHILQKQKAHKLDKRENVIYVGSKSNIRVKAICFEVSPFLFFFI